MSIDTAQQDGVCQSCGSRKAYYRTYLDAGTCECDDCFGKTIIGIQEGRIESLQRQVDALKVYKRNARTNIRNLQAAYDRRSTGSPGLERAYHELWERYERAMKGEGE